MFPRKIVIGTRGSALALWQTEYVAGRLHALTPALDLEVVTIKTHGDRVRDRALPKVGGVGLFVKEIEAALLSGQIDLAVHSLKDMPTVQPERLILGAILGRADARDALVLRDPTARQVSGAGRTVQQLLGGGRTALDRLAPGARVGTSSLRRRAQLLAARPDLQVLDLRGNVDTRLHKLFVGEYDAVVLAVAGLARLGRGSVVSEYLPPEVMLPAAGQGALCVEVRAAEANADDGGLRSLIATLDHLPTRQATGAERALVRRLEGGCQVPIGAYARTDGDRLELHGLVATPDGSRLVRDMIDGPALSGEQLGAELAEQLLAAGAGQILEMAGGRDR